MRIDPSFCSHRCCKWTFRNLLRTTKPTLICKFHLLRWSFLLTRATSNLRQRRKLLVAYGGVHDLRDERQLASCVSHFARRLETEALSTFEVSLRSQIRYMLFHAVVRCDQLHLQHILNPCSGSSRRTCVASLRFPCGRRYTNCEYALECCRLLQRG